MFTVDEATAAAIRCAYGEGGELSGIVEFRRHVPLITDHAKAGECVRIIAGWQPWPDRPPQAVRQPALDGVLEQAPLSSTCHPSSG
jgi:hypothetical protein